MKRKRPPDRLEYVRRAAERCFICAIAAGEDTQHHLVYEDDVTVAFLNRFPTLEGQVVVAPREHREDVVGEYTIGEYLELQRVVWKVADGVRRALEPERVYLLSLGSRAANAHVHWHVAPLPAGVPFEEQQLEALSWDRGVLELRDDHLAKLARRIRGAIDAA